jgi:hypothetical protein
VYFSDISLLSLFSLLQILSYRFVDVLIRNFDCHVLLYLMSVYMDISAAVYGFK